MEWCGCTQRRNGYKRVQDISLRLGLLQRVYEEAMESDDAEELLSKIKKSKHYTLDSDMTYISILNAVKIIYI